MKLYKALFLSYVCQLGCSLALLVGLSGGAQAQATDVRFTYAANGTEVTDAKTGLTWQRCSVGQTWRDSTCTGVASSHTHKQAVGLAKTNAGWRLPTVKELSSLVDTSRSNPTIDAAVFPATPSAWFCTASPYLGSASLAWYVGFLHGDTSPLNREQRHHIRLVRE